MNRAARTFWFVVSSVCALCSGAVFLSAAPAGATPVFNSFYSFSALSGSANPDGTRPTPVLLQGSDGNFYGTTDAGGTAGKGTVFEITPSGTFITLHSFGDGSVQNDGATPSGNLIEVGAGNFYGTTQGGGTNGTGTIFTMTSGGTFTILHSFTALSGGTNSDGANPYAGLIQGSDGNFYGTTEGGGANGAGTVFQIAGSGAFTTLYSFSALSGGTNSDGANPYAGLIQGSDGNFYGTTQSGGTSGDGTVFEVTSAGTLTTLVSFTGTGGATPGQEPYGRLTQASNGNLYGTTFLGGTDNDGTVFSITSSGTFTTLVNFGGSLGSKPSGGLFQGSDGNFYGTTQGDGTSGDGTVFKMTPAGTLTTLVDFTGTGGANLGSTPYSGLIQASDGNLYGTTLTGGTNDTGTIYEIQAQSQVLYDFSVTDGAFPYAGLLQGSDGNFYGTTESGGANGDGTVFQVTTSGTLTTLHGFTSPVGTVNSDGVFPYAGLIQGSDGNFYGTTESGGSSGTGTVFQVTSTGTLTTLYNFSALSGGINSDGAFPYAKLIQGSDGNFYGTTESGGANGDGTLFKITSTGTLTTLYSFSGGNDGAFPLASLLQGSDGNFYGTTESGGANGTGTVFQVTASGTLTTLYSFSALSGGINSDGAYPYANLLQGSDGNFYGTTESGGATGYGTVFVIVTDGTLTGTTLTTLYSFSGGDGAFPYAGLLQGSDGNFYGTTQAGGMSGEGTVFKMTPAGTLTTLVDFAGTNGRSPYADLFQGSDGNFYGTTDEGGIYGYGTIFQLYGVPVGFGGMQTTGENTPLSFTVAFNDPSGMGIDSIAFPIAPSHGTLTVGAITETGTTGTVTLTYTPATNDYGSDNFTYTVTGFTGTSAPQTIALAIDQVPASVTISPATVLLTESGMQTFTAVVEDGGGVTVTPDSLTWSVSGGGTIDASTGGFTAGATTGTYTVTATASLNGVMKTGTASVTVIGPPTVTLTPGTQTSTQALFTATANSGDGTPLTYAWSVTPAASFTNATTGSNGSGSPFSNTITIGATASYTVTVMITDAYGQTASATATATFTQIPTTAVITPPSATLPTSASQTFTAAIMDQFGAPINAPALTWSITAGAGTLSSSTISNAITYTAPAAAGAATVTVVSGSASATASVTIDAPAPTPTITNISPPNGTVGTTIIITGTGFTGTTSVTINGVSVAFTVVSSTEITVTIPAGATTGVIQVTTPGGTVTSAAPYTVLTWAAVGVGAAGDGTSRILWTRSDGAAGLWVLNTNGVATGIGPTYGPYPGWTAVSIATANDGTSRVLWTNTNGQAGIWSFNTNGIETVIGQAYGPYSGWTAKAVGVASDGTARVLWTNVSGAMGLWTFNTAGIQTKIGPAYGPVPGWTATSLSTDTNGVSQVLWTRSDAAMAIWSFSADDLETVKGPVYGPYSGWSATAVGAAPPHNSGGSGGTYGGTSTVLWNRSDGATGLWTLDGTGTQQTIGPTYGPVSGWTAKALSVAPDGTARVLWDRSDRAAGLWLFGVNDQDIGIGQTYGPY